MSSVLLTGASGFIGSHMSKNMKGQTVFKCDTKPGFGVWPPDEIDSLFSKIDCIYHLGAISSTTETNTEEITKNNILFTCYLIEKAVSMNIPLVYASSASVYLSLIHI